MIVSIMASCGFTHEYIASKIKIDPKTLRRAFREDLDEGMKHANALVAQSLFRKATGDGKNAVTAAIWWEKTRSGKRDMTDVCLTGANGEPLIPQRVLNEEALKSMGTKELEALIAAAERLAQ